MGNCLVFAVFGIIFVVSSSCSHYTKTEKVLFVGMLVADGADIYTTEMVLDRGGREMNPLLGSQPSDGELIMWGAGNVALMMVLGEVWPEYRKWLFGGSMVVHGGGAVWNVGQF